ncbi:phosphoribosylaminoimidazolesuccinocarboxamide synthase [Ornithinibacillus scapharcae]|uniref:phosphoribosylaminoimidazolesuccinocarboxamide synthase n=1 Tax=Ornithinibacillus scapharcae TaxID=1147159 RepID=UPI000225BF00|nr:phosphoribosylaminoimidazolesuccinocarboxamide synthase [Ornithinibacillus scapharcae]
MKAELLYEGKAKKVYLSTTDSERLVLSYKNDATAFNGKKKENFPGKGRLNNEITSVIFPYLHEKGIKSHFVKKLNETEQLVLKTTIIPLEVVVRNLATGSITKRLGFKEETPFSPPLVELFYKNDSLNDPLINDDHALLLTNISAEELRDIKAKAIEINTVLQGFFRSMNLILVDFKLEFGLLSDGTIILADEISPDTCRLWDIETKEKMDKDVFRQGIGDLITVYEKILQRLEARV